MSYIYNMTDTWDDAGVTWTAIKMNVTDTASAAASRVMDLQVGGSSLFVLAKGGNVGIGTSSPGAKLNIVDNSASDAVRITQTGAGNALVVEDSANPDATPFIITGAGNVGIRVTPSPSAAALTQIADGGIFGAAGNNASFAANVYYDAGSWRYASATTACLYQQLSGAHFWFTAAAGAAAGDAITWSERMRIDSSGNVGIGTSSPTARLTAKGGLTQVFNYSGAAASPSETFDWPFPALEVTSYGDFTSQTMLALTLPNDGGYYTGYSVWNFKLHQTASSTTSAGVSGCTFGGPGYLGFAPGGSERMRIDSSGNVGIGTSSPGVKLDVQGSGSVYARALSTDTTGGAVGYVGAEFAGGSALQIRAGAGYTYLISTGASDPLLFGTNTTERMRIDSSGNVGIGESAPDYKLDVNGTFGFTPGSSVTPVDNGDVVFELTNNTTLTIKARGSDGVVRSGTITLS